VDDTALVGADVQLHPEVPVLAFARMLHLRVASPIGIFGGARRRDDGRIDNGSRAPREQAANRLEDCTSEAVPL
jgi:hypothetical protein